MQDTFIPKRVAKHQMLSCPEFWFQIEKSKIILMESTIFHIHSSAWIREVFNNIQLFK
jgi:hypothetical protein